MLLNPEQQEYINLQWRLLRQANAKAADFSRKWNAQNEAMNDWLDRSGITDPVQRAKRKADNLALLDLFGAWDFWQREARRIHCAISGELLCTAALQGESLGILAGA